jgi:hypothetical protein
MAGARCHRSAARCDDFFDFSFPIVTHIVSLDHLHCASVETSWFILLQESILGVFCSCISTHIIIIIIITSNARAATCRQPRRRH